MRDTFYLNWMLVGACFLVLTQPTSCLSTWARKSLEQALHGVDPEKRHEQLEHLAEMYFGKKIKTIRRPSPPKPNKFDENSTVGGEMSIEDINMKEGVAEYLFQGDINLTEEQMRWIESGITAGNVTRQKHTKKREIVKEALNFIRARTCLEFTESSTAANRVRVFSGAGCFATIGMAGGVGIAAHEFAHALGVWHTQMRDDRDSFVRVDLSAVPPGMLHNYIKLPASRIINYTPYEYGSYMHYDSRSFATRGDSIIPLDSSYLRTLGSRLISFYDIKMLNDHYNCQGNKSNVFH
ncbi:unnamed protein product [Nippostrongylus brasiliensis]|uniref:Metalloendopeptidase n=1 Tax=Nippostrongylus brasiliensis TaxID=27835 RepID=A0A0N4XY51_NIPBR|nr:unnamed protein product [Nippostrongylus brasiliensis]